MAEVHATGLIAFLLHHPLAVLSVAVFADQIGLPLPTGPLLLAAGALAGQGRLDTVSALGVCVVASVLSELLWWEAGRRRGSSILSLLCRISIEPDSCVRRTENVFVRHGARTLLVAKFVPGLATVAPPLAGIIGMPLSRFVPYAGAGALIWAGTYFLLGYIFSDQLEDVARHAATLGAFLVAAFAAWLGWKYAQRHRFLRNLRMARISPEDLRLKLEAGETLVVVDLRGALDFAADPSTIPGALRLSAEELAERHDLIPRDREIVLYCT
ncbi:MAG TPA: VTT domain-containing protein [Vicinamibacteria bacterium]|nr:VTT domain-containing protein [Vicinamibacteria bacterium]